jgi:predicted aldo/keto reductase-like oxidoreductase
VGVECGVCVERCPFDVEIIAKMREAAALFRASPNLVLRRKT